jgi:hypothetical protein
MKIFPKLEKAILDKKQPGYDKENCPLHLTVDNLKRKGKLLTDPSLFAMGLSTVIGGQLSIVSIDISRIYYDLCEFASSGISFTPNDSPVICLFAIKLPVSTEDAFKEFASDFSKDLITIENELAKGVELKELNNGLKGLCVSKIPGLKCKKDIFMFLSDLKERGYLSEKALTN